MKTLIILSILFTFSSTTWGSAVYMNNGRVQTAIEAIHGTSAGVGGKAGSCLLCHATTSGGLNNLNSSFGADFRDAAQRVMGTNGGGDLQATGPNSLQSIFSETAFASTDSDRDGDSNAVEFAADTDPADDVSGSSGSSGGDSGGCGMIAPPNGKSGFPPASMLLVLLPLVVLLHKKSRLISSAL